MENNPQDLNKRFKLCAKCNLRIDGQFVRAVKAHYHLECFRCLDCNQIVADKFFPVTTDGVTSIYCEIDYFKRLELICARCNQALRGPYIRVNTQKYHMEHFSCSVCGVVFKQHDSYYEKDGQVYCGQHYSILYASKCGGCHTAVLKNFVETTKGTKTDGLIHIGTGTGNGEATQWHPCCYMIYKLWNIRLSTENFRQIEDTVPKDPDVEVEKQRVMVEKVEKILQILSTFEESAAESISEMLIHFTNDGYMNGAIHAHRLISHIDVLFSSLQDIDDKLNSFSDPQHLSSSKEPKQLVKKIVSLFSLLSSKQESTEKPSATKDMIQLVTSLAHVLKIVIRKALAASLRLEQIHGQANAVTYFLEQLQSIRSEGAETLSTHLSFSARNDSCTLCKSVIEEECFQFGDYKWHRSCLKCSNCQVALLDLDMTFVDPNTLSLYCPSHRTPLSVTGIKKLGELKQYLTFLCSALNRLFVILQIDESQLLAPIQDPNPRESVAPIPDPFQKGDAEELFFDNEETEHVPPVLKNLRHEQTVWKVEQDGHDGKSMYLSDATALNLFAIRQNAAASLSKYLGSYFTVDKLLRIVDGKKSSIWSKMFKKSEKKKIHRTFGTPLDILVEQYGTDSVFGFGPGTLRIPYLMQECISQLKRQDLTIEGIFRKNGNIRRLKDLCEQIDMDPLHIDLRQENAIQIAALMKKFLRDLPEPLLTTQLYDVFLCIPKVDVQDRETVLHLILCLLPKPNIDLLCVLVRFFAEVASYSGDPADPSGGNKMHLENLATVIAPNILYNKNSTADQSGAVIEIVKMILKLQSKLFKIPELSDGIESTDLGAKRDGKHE
ncbi:hypothetical protein BC833DRAFT_656075 [Globomyces pollinis-pini]|nr:hypothetical protein BC833DRAFT_656075 [Globomyces pollinis-pini]